MNCCSTSRHLTGVYGQFVVGDGGWESEWTQSVKTSRAFRQVSVLKQQSDMAAQRTGSTGRAAVQTGTAAGHMQGT